MIPKASEGQHRFIKGGYIQVLWLTLYCSIDLVGYDADLILAQVQSDVGGSIPPLSSHYLLASGAASLRLLFAS